MHQKAENADGWRIYEKYFVSVKGCDKMYEILADIVKYIFVFAETEDKNQRIIDELKKYLLLETLHIRQPQNEELIPHLSTKLKEKKLLLDEIEFVKCIKDIDLTFQYGSYEKIEFLVNRLDYYRYVKGYNHDLFTSVIEELQTKTDRKNNRIGF